MKKSFSIFLILVTLTTLFSCTKIKNVCNDNVIQNYDNDTIYPSPYLMKYPGSWWEYTDGNIINCSAWVNVNTHKSIPNGDCKTIFENNHILPSGTIYYDSQLITYADHSDS